MPGQLPGAFQGFGLGSWGHTWESSVETIVGVTARDTVAVLRTIVRSLGLQRQKRRQSESKKGCSRVKTVALYPTRNLQ